MKGRKTRATGGEASYEKDLSKKNMKYTYESNVNDEAVEKKKGGKVSGAKSKANAGRSARKSGGRTGSNMNPLSSAHAGTNAPGRKVMDIE